MSSTLLSTTEHHAFMSFLHTVDDIESQWQTFDTAPPRSGGSAALAKATKDLIALHPAPNPHFAPRPILIPQQPIPIHPYPALSIAPPRSPGTRLSKRPRPTPPSPSPTPSHTLPSPSAGPQSRTTLLSPQQKKANHIQSEQKRRANIRRGYEALCETVPALREALRAEEDPAAPSRRKRARTEDGEKVDGRAGPRSESVVLQKSIEYIRALREHRSALLARLERARTILGPGHPSLLPQGPSLWEREWDGGKGLMADVDGSEEDDE